MTDLVPSERFMMAVGAHGLGVILLILIGWIPFSDTSDKDTDTQQKIRQGLWAVKIAFILAVVAFLVCLTGYWV